VLEADTRVVFLWVCTKYTPRKWLRFRRSELHLESAFFYSQIELVICDFALTLLRKRLPSFQIVTPKVALRLHLERYLE